MENALELIVAPRIKRQQSVELRCNNGSFDTIECDVAALLLWELELVNGDGMER